MSAPVTLEGLRRGVADAVRADPALALGVNTWDGVVTNDGVAAATGTTAMPVASVLG